MSLIRDEQAYWRDDTYICIVCGKPFHEFQFDIARQFEKLIPTSGGKLDEVETIASKTIAIYCSRECRAIHGPTVLESENIHPTYPDIKLVEICSRCGSSFFMTDFHLTYIESLIHHEDRSRMSVSMLEIEILAVLCQQCAPPPRRLLTR